MWNCESARVPPNHETIAPTTVLKDSSLLTSLGNPSGHYSAIITEPHSLQPAHSHSKIFPEDYGSHHLSHSHSRVHLRHQHSLSSLLGAGHPANYGQDASTGRAQLHHGSDGGHFTFSFPMQQSSFSEQNTQQQHHTPFSTAATIMGGASNQQQQQQLQQLSTLSLDSAGLYGPSPEPGTRGIHRLLPNQPQRQHPQAPHHLKRNKSCYAHYHYRSSIRQQPKPSVQAQNSISTQNQLTPLISQMNVSGNGTGFRTPYHQPLFYRASSPVFDQTYTSQEYGRRRPSIREQLGLARSFEDLPINSSSRHFNSPKSHVTPIHEHGENSHSRATLPRKSASSSSSSDEISSPRHTPRQILISYRNPFDEIDSLDNDGDVDIGEDDENEDDDDNRQKADRQNKQATGSNINTSQSTIDPACVRTVLLHKFASDKGVHNRRSGGITLCGGLEVGLTSVYISRVATNSAAAKCGLSPGDEILSADYENFVDGTITCKRAYDILERDREVIVLSILPRQDAFTSTRLRHLTFDWLDPRGRPASPPKQTSDIYSNSTPTESLASSHDDTSDDSHIRGSSSQSFFTGFRVRAPKLRDLPRAAAAAAQHRLVTKLNNHFSFFKSRKSSTPENDVSRPKAHSPDNVSRPASGRNLSNTRIRQVVINLEKGIDLGLGIRGGIEYGLGIYITRVEPDSSADKAGLKVGDQIMSVNRFDFTEVLHDEAVDILRSSFHLSMKIKHTGKVPACQHVNNSERPVLWSPRHSPNHRYQVTPTSTTTSSGLGPESGTNYRTPPVVVTPTSAPGSGSPRSRHSPSGTIHSLRGHNHPILVLDMQHQASHQNHHYHHLQQNSHQTHSSSQQQPPPQTAPPILRHYHSESHTNSHVSITHDRETPALMITGSLECLPLRDIPVHDDVSDDVMSVEIVHSLDAVHNVQDDITDDLLGERYFDRDCQFKHLKLMRYQKELPSSRSEEEEQILDEECIKYLSDTERISFAYYRNEYETKSLDIDAFVDALVELLNTETKYSVMFHLYHSIKSNDLIRFQELIYAKRPIHRQQTHHNHLHSTSLLHQQQQKYSKVYSIPIRHTSPGHVHHSNIHHSPLRHTHLPDSTCPQQESCESSSFDFMSQTTGDIEVGVMSSDSPGVESGLEVISGDVRRFSNQFQNQHIFNGNDRLSRSECLMNTRLMGVSGTKSPLPNPVAYRKQFMTRRHSSGTSETSMAERQSREYQQAHQYPDSTMLHRFEALPIFGGDDRRWSFNVAAGNRRSSNVFNPTELRTTSPCVETISPVKQTSQLLGISTPQSRKGSHVSVCLTPAGPKVITEVTPASGGTSPLHLTVDCPSNVDGTVSGSNLSGTSGGVHQHRRNSGNHLIVPDISGPGSPGGGGNPTKGVSGTDTDDECFEFPTHLRVRRHRSLPSPTSYTSADVQFASVPPPNKAHQRSASFRLPNHKAITEPNGRWRVQVKKTKSFLGIAIEGGLNVTTQTQPRIISIHNDGAAVLCTDLRVGHIIMEVDGQTTASMNHQQVAAMISRAYYNTPHKDYVEFLVREKSRAEFDLRRSSFMLLNNSFE